MHALCMNMMDLWDFAFVPSAFPSFEEIEALQLKLTSESEDERKDAAAALLKHGEDVGKKSPEPLFSMMTKEIFRAVNQIFTDELLSRKQWFGSDQESYVTAFGRYRDDVISKVLSMLPTAADHKERLVANNMKAKLQYISSPGSRGYVGLMPFITPSVLLAIDAYLKMIDLSIREVS